MSDALKSTIGRTIAEVGQNMIDRPTAFPCSINCVDGQVQSNGMSLRDYFAGQALAGMTQGSPEDMAARAYARADAMLAAREKKP